MKSNNSRDFVSAKPHARLTTGEVIKMLRELKGWTQKELSKRSEQFARAFDVHPSIIMFPEYERIAIKQVA